MTNKEPWGMPERINLDEEGILSYNIGKRKTEVFRTLKLD